MATKKATKKTVISQLQSVGEGALGKITHSPATRTALQGAMAIKDRGGKVLHGLESIEERLIAIEKRLAALEGKGATRARSTATKARSAATKSTATTASKPRSTATKPRSTTRKPSS
jgi:hypothetical protein